MAWIKKKRIAAKQVYKVLGASVGVAGFAVGTAWVSIDVTTPLTTALWTAWVNGGSVAVQVAANDTTPGIKTGDIVEIYDSATGEKINDGNGNEVYGRITEAAGVYTLSFYSLVAGTETAYNMPTSTLDFIFTYQFDFVDYPTNGALSIKSKKVQDDIKGGAKSFTETLTVTAIDTVSNTTKTVSDVTKALLFVNGQMLFSGDTAPAFSITTGWVITWNATNAGFNLETTDEVVIQYLTNQ